MLWLTCFCCRWILVWPAVSDQLEAPVSVPWWYRSSFNSVDSCQVRMQRCAASAFFFFFFLWASTGSGSWGLSLVSSQCQTVHPHRGHAKKSRGITRVCFPPRPSLLSLLLHLLLLFLPLSSYIPGALFFAGKHCPAMGGEVELFGGINGNSASGRLPECSCLLCGPLGLRLCCQCQAWWNSYSNNSLQKHSICNEILTVVKHFCQLMF